jgi:hypothetical protein
MTNGERDELCRMARLAAERARGDRRLLDYAVLLTVVTAMEVDGARVEASSPTAPASSSSAAADASPPRRRRRRTEPLVEETVPGLLGSPVEEIPLGVGQGFAVVTSTEELP